MVKSLGLSGDTIKGQASPTHPHCWPGFDMLKSEGVLDDNGITAPAEGLVSETAEVAALLSWKGGRATGRGTFRGQGVMISCK